MRRSVPCTTCSSLGDCVLLGDSACRALVEWRSEDPPEDPDGLRAEEMQAAQDARFAEMDRHDRSGPAR